MVARKFTVHANKEVVLSAGAIGTPQILMLSGIGNATQLRKAGVTPIVSLPDVGQHLQDHAFVPLQWDVNSNNTFDNLVEDPNQLAAAHAQWVANHTGPLADNPVMNHIGFLRLPANNSVIQRFGDPSAGPNSPHYEIAFGVSL